MSDQITPNVVIPEPRIRLLIGGILYVLSVLAGLAALLFIFFPELSAGTDIPGRAVAFVNAAVGFLSGAFGLVVTLPNVPKGPPANS